jgi:solute carrier family 29 (equilibrative nucleoside transporter), member 1/2/3
MDWFRSLFKARETGPEYEPLSEEGQSRDDPALQQEQCDVPFSWSEYAIFTLLGVAMLWAWFVTHHPPPPLKLRLLTI